ncbi:amidohydrolase [Bacterioplanoides sp.]|uniref:amidohydrolase n=1 Tax=Bacterioplanoides sp. TaxID=2066072 RepID=UPI003B5A2547
MMLGCLDNNNKSKNQKKPLPSNATLYHNAAIKTMDKQNSNANAIITADDKIIAVGTLAEFRRDYRNVDQLKKTDLNGHFVMPGIIDAHTHPGAMSILGDPFSTESHLELSKNNKEEFFSDLRKLAEQTKGQPLVFTGTWHVDMFLPEGPNKAQLDEIFGNTPVILQDNTGHSFWLNSAALAVFGIDKNTPDLSRNISYFVKDENGELTGWAKEFSLVPFILATITPNEAVLTSRLKKLLQHYADYGVTALWDAGNFTSQDNVYSILKKMDDENKLPVRYYASHHIFDARQVKTAVADLQALRKKYAGKNLKFDTIKIHYDGDHALGTAYVKQEYQHIHGSKPNIGGVLLTAKELADFILELNQANIDLHLHTVGNRSIREALDAVKMAKAATELSNEITLSHLEITDPEDIDDLATLSVHANFTPQWLTAGASKAATMTIGQHQVDHNYTLIKSYFDKGVKVTFSSDTFGPAETPLITPFLGIQAGITRGDGIAADIKPALPLNEAVSLEQMLSGYTINAAKQLGISNLTGSLEAGKKADFIVLDQNLLSMDQNQIHKLKPRAVVMDGKLVAGKL